MPNWCENDLTITGQPAAITEFRIRANINNPPKYIEKPNSLNRDHVGEMPDERPLCFNSLYPVPKEILKQGYSPIGYDWEHDNWGVKWGASECTLNIVSKSQINYNFLTPWNPPIKFLIKVSKDFPELEFCLKYKEDGMAIKGKLLIKNGQQIKKR